MQAGGGAQAEGVWVDEVDLAAAGSSSPGRGGWPRPRVLCRAAQVAGQSVTGGPKAVTGVAAAREVAQVFDEGGEEELGAVLHGFVLVLPVVAGQEAAGAPAAATVRRRSRPSMRYS